MKSVNIEDIVTAVCEFFCENITSIHSWDSRRSDEPFENSILWYNNRNQKEKRNISKQLLEIIDEDRKKYGQSTNRKRSINKKM